jgi:hypothetical protein
MTQETCMCAGVTQETCMCAGGEILLQEVVDV